MPLATSPGTAPEQHQQPMSLKGLAILLASLWFGLAFYVLMEYVSGLLTIHDFQSQLWSHLEFATLKIWLPWLFLTPLVILISNRFPVSPDNRIKAVLLHGVFLIALSVIEVGIISFHYHYFTELDAVMATYKPWQHTGHFLFGDELFLFNAIIYTAFIASFNIKNFSRLAEQKELIAVKLNNRLMESQLQALKMQINPHFLFNTLNVISVLVMKSENRQATEMINHLSRFFRHTLDESKDHLIPLAKELEHVGLYLAIEKVRFGDRLKVIENYDSEALSVTVPSMLLQPMVENAMAHGLGQKLGPGQLTLECRRFSDHIKITMTDDGAGCDFTDKSSYREGIGISNVRSRLQQIYGQDYVFSLASGEQEGVVVTIELPLTIEKNSIEQKVLSERN